MRNNRCSSVVTTTSALLLTVAGVLFSAAAGAEPASGTINYQSKAGTLAINAANVYLVKGSPAHLLAGRHRRETAGLHNDVMRQR
jgi:hypothetical protein